MKIAVIGAGVSGHAVAWNLRGAGHEIDVYERTGRLGGECSTVHIAIGGEERWADLGVNDFNRRTYRNVVAVMDEVGAEYRDLEDTACFYTGDDEIVYTLDDDSDTPMQEDLRAEFRRFRDGAAEFVENIHAYDGWTVERYLKEMGFSPDFARLCIYPRVNAMYFVHDQGPDRMPIEAVMPTTSSRRASARPRAPSGSTSRAAAARGSTGSALPAARGSSGASERWRSPRSPITSTCTWRTSTSTTTSWCSPATPRTLGGASATV